MTIIFLVTVSTFSRSRQQPPPREDPQKILVDASKSGGVWWAPQVEPFDPNSPHQGKSLADYFRSLGNNVTELPKNAPPINLTLLSHYDLVIAIASYSHYSAVETAAYKKYVSNGGSLLLLTDFLGVDRCNLSLAFELNFRGPSQGENVVDRFENHPITNGVSNLTYIVGSGLLDYPSEAHIIGWLSDDTFIDLNDNDIKDSNEPSGAPVLGFLDYGRGTIMFFGDVNCIEHVEQPFTDNYIEWLLSQSNYSKTTTETTITTITETTTIQSITSSTSHQITPGFTILNIVSLLLFIIFNVQYSKKNNNKN